MKVYLVHHGEYSDYTVDAVFSDENMAKKYCDLHNKYGVNFFGYAYEYEEWDTIECIINMQKERNQVGYLYHFDKKGHLEEKDSPRLEIQNASEDVYTTRGGYNVVIYANDRSEAQCRKIACDKVAAYRAREELI